MLFDLDRKPITKIPHEGEYRTWRNALDRVDPNAYQRIHDALTDRFSGSKIETSSWVPGSHWQDTPWFPIYLAVGQDENQSGLFFGLLVWQVVMDHPESWAFGKYELNGSPIRGLTYFRIQI